MMKGEENRGREGLGGGNRRGRGRERMWESDRRKVIRGWKE